MAGRFSIEAVFRAVDRITAPVNRMQNRVGRFSRSMESGLRRLDRSASNFAGGMRRAGLAAAAALAIAGGAMGSVISTGAEFEQTLVDAAVKFPGEIRKGTEAFEQLEQAARHTGSTTEFTASQSASALNFMAMAGFNAEQAIAALPGVVDLATAAGLDLATATDVATDSLGAFGLMTSDAADLSRNLARVNDVLAATSTSANTTVEAMFDAIRDGAPVATAAGASIETYAALVGELANSGLKGGRAGTILRAVFTRLQAPTGEAAGVLNRLGIQTRDAGGNMLDVIDILEDFSRATEGMGNSQRAAALKAIFGEEALSGVNVLLDSGADKLREYRTELESVGGVSTEMADVMRDTLQGRLKSLSSAVEGVKISIFSLSEGPLSDAIEQTTEWVRANESLIATNVGGWLASVITNFKDIVVWGKRIATVVGVFLAFSLVLKTFIVIMTAVNLVMAMNPIGLMILGIIALIAAVAAAIIWFDKIKAAFMAVDDSIFVIGAAMLALVIGPIGLLIGAAALIVKHWEGIKDFFASLWDGITLGFDLFVAGFTAKVDRVKSLWDSISGFGSRITSALGFGDDEDAARAGDGPNGPQVVSPQERVARSIEETRSTSAAEVTIRDETGRATVTGGSLGNGVSLFPSGGF